MIYELALVLKPDAPETTVPSIYALVEETVKSKGGQVLLTDDWGVLRFAQNTSHGQSRGHYLYVIYSSTNPETNPEIERRLGINEHVMRSLNIKLGLDSEQEELLKKYKTPYSKKFYGSQVEEVEGEDYDSEKDRRKFSRKRACWFDAKNIKADWKDPKTYNWLLSEFGKISPGRVSGVSSKHQRFVTVAIKRARFLCLASNMTGDLARGN